MFEKLERLKAFLEGNVLAFLIIIAGGVLVLLKHEEAGKMAIAGGLTHIQK